MRVHFMLALCKMIAVETADGDTSTGKGQLRTGHDGPENGEVYSSTLSLISALDGVVVNATPRPLFLQERLRTHCRGVCFGPRVGVDGC